MKLIPLTPTVGAEIHGLDLTTKLSEANVGQIKKAFLDHLLLVFRDQLLDAESLDKLGRQFGPPHIQPSDPGVPGYPSILAVHTDKNSKTYAGSKWHSDVSCDQEPPMGSILHLHQVPPSGGDTLFANMFAAYDDLSEIMQGCIQNLKAINASEHHFKGYFGYNKYKLRNDPYPEAVHPVVRTHPESGRKALFVNPTFTTHIADMAPGESEVILDFLFAHLAQPKFQCRVKWQPDTVVMWDNRPTMHARESFDFGNQRRIMHRTTLVGDGLVA